MTCEACRTIAPFVAKDYELAGTYETIGNVRTYVTGSKTATAGIVDIFDVFGFSTQTLQGADILASETNSLVVVPDLFDGQTLSHDCIPPDTDEKKETLSKFLGGPASVSRVVGLFPSMVEGYQEGFPAVKKWAAFGLCWGGKVG
ncbi:hypothetical protein LTR84_003546 [Exophiala bonariae]|uniref:Dienelactone hydrolase domain-containing protein n=1 Tax=Exophiala bonariae TaxID=1690606 RepID=A0AAV9NAZ9_9EURO|nr:hypothetical protein LTR84_003546 [Exophiala bonariae]